VYKRDRQRERESVCEWAFECVYVCVCGVCAQVCERERERVCALVFEINRASLIWMNFVSEDVRVGGFYFDIHSPVKKSKIEKLIADSSL